jgi:DNA-binding transcriptional LysR family regulator
MGSPRSPTLDQLQVFLAVVDAGSFVGAAKRLSRATSVVSYAIDNLESQLGLELFDRQTTRKPRLTESGQAILADVRKIAIGVDDLLAKARGRLSGLEAEVVLVVDVMLPNSWLVEILEAFHHSFPTVSLRLHVEALGAVAQRVLDRVASVGISGPLDFHLTELERQRVGAVDLIPVAAPSHPLSQHSGLIPNAVARDHIQLVLTDRSTLTSGRDYAVVAIRSLRLTDLSAKHALLLAGVGWGSMPLELVQGDLAAGRLVALQISEWFLSSYPLQIIHRIDTPPGPAGRWLSERFKARASSGK